MDRLDGMPWGRTCRADYRHQLVESTPAAQHGYCPYCWEREKVLTAASIARLDAQMKELA